MGIRKKIPFTVTEIVVAIVILLCSRELFFCIKQLFHVKFSNIPFNCIGTFVNSGPLGGYFSVCISLLLAYRFWGNIKWLGKICGYFSLLLFVFLSLTTSRAGLLSLLIGCLPIVFRNKRYHNLLKKNIYWILLLFSLASITAYLIKKPSADARLHIDHICFRIIRSNIHGVGNGNFAGAFGEEQASYFEKKIASYGNDSMDWTAINQNERLIADCPNMAFNEYIDICVENGIYVAFVFIGMMIYLIIISKKNHQIWICGILALATFSLFSYPFHIRQFQILFLILFISTILQQPKCTSSIINTGLLFAAYFTLLSTTDWNKCFFENDKLDWKGSLRWYQGGYFQYFVDDCDSMSIYNSEEMLHDEQFLFDYGHSLFLVGDYSRSDSILRLGASISSDPMFWNIMGNSNLAMGNYLEAEACYKHAFYMVPNRLYPLNLLAKLYHEEGDTVRFIKMAEMVESFKPKIESLSTEKMRMEIRELETLYCKDIKEDER